MTTGHSSGPVRKRGYSRRIIIAAVLAALTVPFAVGYVVSVYVLFPAPEVRTDGIAVPDLAGRNVIDAEAMLTAAGLGELDTMALPHQSAARGEVLAQDPLPGQQLRAGAAVRAAVSAGPPRVVIPDVLGFGADAADQLLRRMGFTTQRAEQASGATAGRVLRVEPQSGTEVQLPASITIIVSTGEPAAVDPAVAPTDSVQSIGPRR